MNSLEHIIQQRPPILVFLADAQDVTDFVLTGALGKLAMDYAPHYVIPSAEAARMRALAPNTLTSSDTFEIEVSSERRAAWRELMEWTSSVAPPPPSLLQRYTDGVARLGVAAKTTARFILPTKIHHKLKTAVHMARTLPKRSKRIVAGAASSMKRALQSTRSKKVSAHLKDTAKHRTDTPAIQSTTWTAAAFEHSDPRVSQTLKTLGLPTAILEIVDLANPLLVVVPSSNRDVFCNDVLWLCREEYLTCVLLQSRWGDFSQIGDLYHKPSFVGCWGAHVVDDLHKVQGLPRVIGGLIGPPRYPQVRPSSATAIGNFRTHLGLKPDDRVLLVGGSRNQRDDIELLQKIDAAIEAKKCPFHLVIYRHHAEFATHQRRELARREWKHVVLDPTARPDAAPDIDQDAGARHHLAELISTADVVITPVSTLLVEAMLLRKPVLVFARRRNKAPTEAALARAIKKSGALSWCNRSDRIVQNLAALMKDSGHDPRATKSSRLLSHIIVTGPGSYAERLASFVRATVEPEAQKLSGLRTMKRRRTISHAYGADLIAREYARANLENPLVPGYWIHGWIPPFHNVEPVFVALHKKDGQRGDYDYVAQIREEKETTPQWVTRHDQADFLKAHGYRHVEPIGLPFCYLPDDKVERVPGSLLVMPPHSLELHGAGNPLAEEYADAIADIRRDFDHIWLCLNEEDIVKRQWLDSFRRVGISHFCGAMQSDPYTLHRLKRVLNSFECVTTNGFGSHIVYAAYCGARVSIYGPFAAPTRERISRSHSVKMFPDLADVATELCAESAIHKHYSFLFAEPNKTIVRRDWGAFEIGEQHRLAPDALARLFGWKLQESCTRATAESLSLPG